MTAAYELTATPELRERFDVTVHQLGWRVGGKGASGRNAEHAERIEEHGLHVWFGFYDHALRLMRDAYAELGRAPGEPLATFEEAFVGCDQLVLYDRQGDGWQPLQFDCPRNFLRPGDAGPLPTFWEIAATACSWALAGWRGLRDERGLAPAEPDADLPLVPDWFEGLARDLAEELVELPLDTAERLLGLAARLAELRAGSTEHLTARHAAQPSLLVKLLRAARDWLWLVLRERCVDDPDLRFFFTGVDAGVSTLAGIVEDDVLERGFDAINGEEWSAWLARHGAKEVTIGATPELRAPVLRSVYDVAFGYPGGEIAKADVAAGTATSDLLRLAFSYRGSIMYKMQAGMGDVVFTPLYQVLERRGVRFEFFRSVERLGVAPDAARIDSIDIVPQVELAEGIDAYDPLVEVGGIGCWPSTPRWEQLADGTRLAAEGIDFELTANPLGAAASTLTRGEDFDAVVLAIPVGALASICEEPMRRDERFRRGIESAVTVRTQAFQLWSTKSAAELGWTHSENSVAGCYVEPLDTYCDMTHLLPREAWTGADGVKAIAYFCGVLDERVPAEDQAAAAERVKRNAIEFCERDLTTLWPGARGPDGSFDWSVLADREGRSGSDRFDAQYWRANTTPSERYVLTPAGSVEHRLPSGDSGFENLVLAGDWTRNGIDGGCVEAAVISGIEAAAALTGVPTPIPGRDPNWIRPLPVELPPYVEFGGRATTPPPFLSTGGRMRGFVLEGDTARIDAFVERVYNVPAGRTVDYRSLGTPNVLLLLGGFEHVSCLTPPFDRWGSVAEIMASFWIPVLAGRDHGEVFVAERLVLAVPYIFVDNPMSYLGGRETYGYAKTMARFDPADAIGDSVRMETFGGNFGRDQGAAWRPFLDVELSGPPGEAAEPPVDGPAGLVNRLVGDLPPLSSQGELVLPGMRLGADLVEDMLDGRVWQLFLKQFRDSADGTRACYQSLVEAPVEIKRVQNRLVPRDAALTIHHLDSHPITDELGVTSQEATLVFDAEIDMVVEAGVEAAPAAPIGAHGASPRAAMAEADGDNSVLGEAARWLWREYRELERVSLGRILRR